MEKQASANGDSRVPEPARDPDLLSFLGDRKTNPTSASVHLACAVYRSYDGRRTHNARYLAGMGTPHPRAIQLWGKRYGLVTEGARITATRYGMNVYNSLIFDSGDITFHVRSGYLDQR